MILRYALFALLATILNLAIQYGSFLVYNGYLSLFVAMFFGTLSGLVLKYILDKKYIFFHTPKNKKDDGKKFLIYSFMGLFTTAIFWLFEMAFDALFAGELAKYAGAVVGLSIGYAIKYYLDKRFVFKELA